MAAITSINDTDEVVCRHRGAILVHHSRQLAEFAFKRGSITMLK
jgi:hypothetical protein